MKLLCPVTCSCPIKVMFHILNLDAGLISMNPLAFFDFISCRCLTFWFFFIFIFFLSRNGNCLFVQVHPVSDRNSAVSSLLDSEVPAQRQRCGFSNSLFLESHWFLASTLLFILSLDDCNLECWHNLLAFNCQHTSTTCLRFIT